MASCGRIGINEDAFLATSRDSTPEALRPMQLIDERHEAHTYTLTFLDAASHESAPSTAVEVP